MSRRNFAKQLMRNLPEGDPDEDEYTPERLDALFHKVVDPLCYLLWSLRQAGVNDTRRTAIWLINNSPDLHIPR